MDLGMSSMQIDNRERGFAYAYDAPLDMRMDPDQELTAKEVVNTWERRRLARAHQGLRRGALRRPDRGRDRPPPRPPGAHHHLRAQRGHHRRDPRARALRRRPPRQAHVPGHPHRRQRRAPAARRRAPARVGASSASAVASPRSRSTHSKTAASSASWPRRPAAASARPTSPSASAATPRRRSSCTAARSSPRRARSRPIPVRSRLASGPPASSPRCALPSSTTRSRSVPLHPRRVSGPVRRPITGRRRPYAAARPRSSGSRGSRTTGSSTALLRSRGCIWLIGILLGGIVAMQVSLLRLNTGISRAITTQETLEAPERDAADADRRAHVGRERSA